MARDRGHGDPMLRTAHGNGAAALLRAETPPLDEIEPLNAADTARGVALAERRGRPFQRGNRAAENRKPALATLGVSLDAADPRCRSALRKANRLRQRRIRELAIQHGGYLGAGPCAMLGAAARMTAASTVLYALATEAVADGKIKEASALFATAAGLDDKARQQELTATALASREAEARKHARGPVDPLAEEQVDAALLAAWTGKATNE